MENKEYLNENQFKFINYKLRYISLILICLGLIIGGGLIYLGYSKQKEIKETYSEEVYKKLIDELEVKITEEENKLKETLTELSTKIKPDQDQIKKLERVKFDGFNDAYYERQDKIEELTKKIAPDLKSISEINNYLSTNWCVTPSITKEVCNYVEEKKSLETTNLKNKIEFESSKCIPFYIGGFFIMFAFLMSALAIYITTKRREILAYNIQSVMPVAQEGIEKMIPTAKKITKEMAPVYGEVAKEISKGIKEGLEDKK